MKKNPLHLMLLVTISVTWLIMSACDRRPLEDRPFLSGIPIKIYWDLAEISPKNATVLFYDETGYLYKEWHVASHPNYAEGSVELPAGKYTAVVFNELPDQIDYVRMRGLNKLSTFEAFSTYTSQVLYTFPSLTEKDSLVHQPGILAACLKTFTVTPNQISQTRYQSANSDFYALSDLHPIRKTASANLVVEIKGLNNARMPAVGELRHMASGYIFATDKNTLTPVTTQFTMNNRTYFPGSKADGTVSATVSTFGVLGESHHTGDTPNATFYLDMAFMLVDVKQTIVEYSVDITNLMHITINENGSITIRVNLEIGPLPDVKPVGGDSGFATDLVNWDKVIIPITPDN